MTGLKRKGRFDPDSPRKKAAIEAQARNLLLLSQKMKILSPDSRNPKKKTDGDPSTLNHPLLRSNPDLIRSNDLKNLNDPRVDYVQSSEAVVKDTTSEGE